MGTSASSKGPGSGPDIPIVPPWVDDPPKPVSQQTNLNLQPAPKAPQDGSGAATGPGNSNPPQTPQRQLPQEFPSPPGRWRGTRTSLGKFAGGGSDRERHLKRALGHYSKSGMGGSRNAARRLGGSSRAAGSLHSALTSLSSGTPLPLEFGIDAQALAGLPPDQAVDVLVNAIRPIDGTQDAEATRDSAARALSEVLAQNPNLTSLTPEQIDQVTASLLGHEVAHRIELDVGKAIIDKAPTKGEGLERLQEMKDYVREVVAAEYAAERAKGGVVGRSTIESISNNALQQTFEVFEDEADL